MSRRSLLAAATGGAAAALGAGGAAAVLGAAGPAGPAAPAPRFEPVLDGLKRDLAGLYEKAKLHFDDGGALGEPAANGAYEGFWPDDGIYPLIADPSLGGGGAKDQLARATRVLTESCIDLPVVPDRVEKDGMPVMVPGADQSPTASHMPLHLPAAWVRCWDVLAGLGIEMPKRDRWAALIARSFEQVPFSCGLAYVDPQHPCVGYAFNDTVAVTGFELMSSLMLHRGLRRAAKLFRGVLAADVLDKWEAKSAAIRSNLHRLYDRAAGAFLAGSKDCRQVSVWGSGLAYWLVDDADVKRRIVRYFRENHSKIFRLGFTRHVAEPEGWSRMLTPQAPGSYQNGGFWPSGTGFVLPAIADQEPAFAADLAAELLDNARRLGYPEWADAEGHAGGAAGLVCSASLPAIALRSHLESKPLIEFF